LDQSDVMVAHEPVDREKVCPLLLRVFPTEGRHRRDEAYTSGRLPSGELQVYTWKDATLRELADLVKGAFPPAQKRQRGVISFAFVYPDREGRHVVRPVGRVFVNTAKRSDDDERTLAALKFVTGDFLDVAVLPQ